MSTVRYLYKRLLSFYPKAFKEQLAESMEQTFSDLLDEKRQTKRGVFGFVLWTFLETTGGILQEHILLMRQGDTMLTLLTNLRSPALISFVLILPFMIMEAVNRRNFNQSFPIPLFIILWLLPVLFILILMPIVKNVRAGNSIAGNAVILLIRVILLSFIVWMWVGIVIDQMPCFLGVPNCD